MLRASAQKCLMVGSDPLSIGPEASAPCWARFVLSYKQRGSWPFRCVSRIVAKETLKDTEALNRRGKQQLRTSAVASANQWNKLCTSDSISSVGYIP
jgi:hypothetical protein